MNTSTEVPSAAIERRRLAAYLAGKPVGPATRASWPGAITKALSADAHELAEFAAANLNLPLGRMQGELKRTAFQLGLVGTEVWDRNRLDVTVDHEDTQWGMGMCRCINGNVKDAPVKVAQG